MTQGNSDLKAERLQLLGEVARLQVSKTTGVPPELLINGSTVEECEQIAAKALDWKGDAPQAPEPTAAVHYGVSQIPRDTLALLSPEQILQAHRQGRLESIGAPAPGPRNNGEHHR